MIYTPRNLKLSALSKYTGLPEVELYFLCHADIEKKVVVLTSGYEVLNLFPVLPLVTI